MTVHLITPLEPQNPSLCWLEVDWVVTPSLLATLFFLCVASSEGVITPNRRNFIIFLQFFLGTKAMGLSSSVITMKYPD